MGVCVPSQAVGADRLIAPLRDVLRVGGLGGGLAQPATLLVEEKRGVSLFATP